MRRIVLLLLAVCACAFAPAASAHSILVGAAEDAPRTTDLVHAKAEMELARLAGLDAIRITSLWSRGMIAPTQTELDVVNTVATAAALDGIVPIVTVMPYGSRVTPTESGDQRSFASYAARLVAGAPTIHDFIVGNEPNLNRYWMPQFNSTGGDVAAYSYESLLALSYDAMKAVDPNVDVIGGSVSPRGTDDPSARPTHSPTTFIRDLGVDYRASGRTKPIMDGFAFHPYGESSKIAPTFKHPRSTSIGLADYPKLVALLGQAFDGTAQRGSTLPILYDEYGVQTQIPAAKLSAYTNLAVPSGRDAVSEAQQALYYTQALQMAACQPNVIGMMLFHTVDEADLDRWQSGMYYADGTPKSSLPAIRIAARAAEAGTGACAVGR